jgi:hypothetical protein
MGQRRDRLDKRQAQAIAGRRKNSLKKTKERSRRDKQMLEIIKNGKFPYTAGVMGWIGQQLDKKPSQIVADDIKSLL